VVLVVVVMVDITPSLHQQLMDNQHLKTLVLVAVVQDILLLLNQLLVLVVPVLSSLHTLPK
jgi:hypothetical protein